MKLEIVNYSQKDSRWKLKKVGTGSQTFGSVGCAVTAVTDLLNYFGYQITPDQLDDNLTANGGFADGNLIKWDVVAKLYPKIKWEGRIDQKGRTDIIDSYLAKNLPVIACVDSNPITSELDQHFVCVTGKDEQGQYFINDPLSNPGDGAYYLQVKYGNNLNAVIWGLRLYSGEIEAGESVESLVEKNKDLSKKLSDEILANSELRNRIAVLESDLKQQEEENHQLFMDNQRAVFDKDEFERELKEMMQRYNQSENELKTVKDTMKSLIEAGIKEYPVADLVKELIKRFFRKG